jgi:hypothetical protein
MKGKRRCRSCGGIYYAVQDDGSEYYHVCPPVPGDTPGSWRERPNKRDENITVDNQGRRVGIKAQGAGVDELAEA